ncbi:hypothetical protein JXO59_05185 [candidate division KSB1 bacterium]|nr:hypothetical protein [candidate division KSB1 bacterium]
MKRIIITGIFLLIAWLLLIGMHCEGRRVHVPVLVTVDVPLQVNSDNINFAETGEADLTEFIEEVREQENFEEILGMYLESVAYTIEENDSKPGTEVKGTIVVRFGTSGAYSPFIEITDINLDAILGVTQLPELDSRGVLEVSKALSPALGGERKIYFLSNGRASKTPPPNLRFKMTLRIAVTVVGVVEVDVPVI